MTRPPANKKATAGSCTAVIGDVGGHADELARVLLSLGANVATGTLPDGVNVVQVGDLIHRSPHSMAVLTLVNRFLASCPDQWTQLIGNHEAQYLRPGGPTFSWPEILDVDGQDMLHDWWDTGRMVVAAHVPTPGSGTIITHAGLTPGFALATHQDVQAVAEALVLAEYGKCVRDGDCNVCDGGHNEGYFDAGEEYCDQFASWVSGALLVLPERDALSATVTRVKTLRDEYRNTARPPAPNKSVP